MGLLMMATPRKKVNGVVKTATTRPNTVYWTFIFS
jgi:hypothetical protein